MTPTPTPTRPGPAAGAPQRRPFPILPVALAVIAVIAAAVVLFSLGDDDDDATTEAGGSSPLVEGGRADPVTETDAAFAAITVEGDTLAELDADADAGTDATVGEVAPVLAGTAPDGTPVDTAAGGVPTVIAVVAHWCPHCGAEVPRIVELVESGALPAETRIVALATASDESAPNFPPGAWLADNDWTGDVLLDDEAATGALALGTSSFPFLVVLDGDGRVVERLAGEQPDGAIAAAVAAAGR